MRKEESKTINDAEGNPHHYTVIQHGAREGLALLPRVLRVVSGPLSGLKGVNTGSLFGESSESGIDLSVAGGALQALAEALIAEDAGNLVDEILKHTIRDGKRVSAEFETAYQGNYGELVQAVIFAVMVNFGASLKRVPFVQGLGQTTHE